MQIEPEDTSELDEAVEQRVYDLLGDRDVVIEILNKLKIIDRFEYELSALASQQLEREAQENAESRAEDMAIARYEYQNNH